MTESIKTDTLVGGVKLFRHYLSTENCSASCGSISFWNGIVTEIKTGSIEYYNNVVDGSNKFLKHIEIHCYSKSIPYPDAQYGGQVTYDLGNGNSRITCPFSDPTNSWLKSAMSHEFGHAYHNWLRFLNHPLLTDVRRWWDHEITIVNSVYSEPVTQFPWLQPDTTIQRDYEQFANSFRILFGTIGTRGDLELVPAGMMSTLAIPDLKRKFQLLPELCAMAMNYGGIIANTLQWDRGFIFQLPGGCWIWQSDYNAWSWHDGSKWNSFLASYTRD